MSHNPPHPPFELVPEKYLKLYEHKDFKELLNRKNVTLEEKDRWKKIKHYFAAISGIDEQFGRLMKALEEKGLKEDTIVVFTSDHGEMMNSHGLIGKRVWYDESLLVPFMIRWPHKITPGKDDLLLSVPDIMPTLMSLMGKPEEIPDELEGEDYSWVFLGNEGGERPESALYLAVEPWNCEGGKRGLKTHRYTFVIDRDIDNKSRRGLHEKSREIRQNILYGDSNQEEKYILYDNKNDPYQLNNIAKDNSYIVKKLKQQLNFKLKEINDPWCNE